MHDIARRKFIKRTVFGGIGLVLAASAAWRIGFVQRARKKGGIESALQNIAGRAAFSSRIGETYLEKDPIGKAEGSTGVLGARLLAVSGGDPSKLEDDLRRGIIDDFSHGRTCNIDGWILSRTECRLSAIAYISRGSVIADEAIETAATAPREIVPFEEMPVVEFATLGRWGPQQGRAKQPFNLQPRGVSALWLRFSNLEGRHYALYFNGMKMRTTVAQHRGVLTASLTAEDALAATSVAGKKPVYLVDTLEQRKQLVGYFMVE